jgi:hypothetical protein
MKHRFLKPENPLEIKTWLAKHGGKVRIFKHTIGMGEVYGQRFDRAGRILPGLSDICENPCPSVA